MVSRTGKRVEPNLPTRYSRTVSLPCNAPRHTLPDKERIRMRAVTDPSIQARTAPGDFFPFAATAAPAFQAWAAPASPASSERPSDAASPARAEIPDALGALRLDSPNSHRYSGAPALRAA